MRMGMGRSGTAGLTRRRMLGGVAAGGTMTWVAPTVLTVGSRAAAGPPTSPPPQTGNAVFLLLDEDAIDNGLEPNDFNAWQVNDDRPGKTQRLPLRYFNDPANFGKAIDLWSGTVGDEGWFAPETIPQSWVDAGPTNDGLQNFILAQTAPFNDTSILDKVPDVVPLRAEGLRGLIGKRVGAVVHDSDISINYDRPTQSGQDGNIKGEWLGVVAFKVLSVTELVGASSGSLPVVRIRILDPSTIFNGAPFDLYDAPRLTTSSIPYDTKPDGNPLT